MITIENLKKAIEEKAETFIFKDVSQDGKKTTYYVNEKGPFNWKIPAKIEAKQFVITELMERLHAL